MLDQGLANSGLYAKSNLPPIFINKILLYSLLIFTLINLHVIYDCFCTTAEELSICVAETVRLAKPKIFHIMP